MRIDDLNRLPLAQGVEKRDPAEDKRETKQTHGGSAGTDSVSVSQLAKALGASDDRRIEQLRLAVESGKYDVSAKAVANSIIDAHLHE